ncbi:hypothetical protein RASY3_09200 [Ruminococcus albus SY3]|uniref:NADAR domain-containing protein n=1 Tax=Ruminococcus albus SY3 TaxID=1341156 RepID=A0A011VZC6_RUMAL|nr:NADAR family protein [Ruminococcus albus]EXM39898.1 hypothetical protein RASY3_09200 [Ruminococcus albus SY3]
MAARIPWDKYETAILIDACIQVINNKMDRQSAIRSVSEKLRKRAVNSGIMIDNVYRNENGIKMQMTMIMSMIQGQEPGLYNSSKLFYEMVELYRSENLTFSSILKEAYIQVEGTDDKKLTLEKLKISDRQVDAVFFHKPDEPFGFLSNWFFSPFEINDTKYTSAEQYIMHQKCLLFGDEESAKAILATEYPEKQQQIGRQAKGYINNMWAGSRQIIAVKGLKAKFSQNEELLKKLFSTEKAYLVECARTDPIWACGKGLNESDRLDASKWRGHNILGFSLMKVREELQSMEKTK